MIDRVISGRYKIAKFLGKGGFGTTFLAKDPQLLVNPLCVVKQFTPDYTEPEILTKLKELFYQEAVMLETLGEHKQIPKLLAKIEENGEDYIVQEYIKGHDLSDELPLGQKKTESEVIQLLIEILEVLEFVHKYKVIHRDIKPDNIRRRESDNNIVLIDFGVVKEISTQVVNGQKQFTMIFGTPGYMPSEQQRGKPKLSSDVYAVGIIAIQSLTGLLPDKLEEDTETGEIIWRKYANVSPKLETVVDKMVSYDFRNRYPTAKEALQAVKKLSQVSIFEKLRLLIVSFIKAVKKLLRKLRLLIVSFIKAVKILPGRFTNGNLLLGIVIVILIIFLIPKNDDWNIYENSQYGITIKYPKRWEIENLENPITGELVNFLSPKQSDKDDFQEKVTTKVYKFSGTADELNKSVIEETKNTLPGVEIVDKGTTTLANKPGNQLIYIDEKGGLKNMQFLTLKGDKAYTITYTAKIDDYDEFVETAEMIIKSLEIH
jgi:eukaryotic-like serine/threonine-protein kinase